MVTVYRATEWPDNAALIADVARLGYIHGRTVDVTYGRGRFWTRFRPDDLTCHDIALDGVDFRELPYGKDAFHTVVFDPPYKLNGTPSLGDFDNAYGIDVATRWQDRMGLILDGVVECSRVLRAGGHLLVKCQDQVVSGRMVWQTDAITHTAELEALGKVDRFDFLMRPRPQPPGRAQVHAQSNYSTLLVFQK